jgi:hypothetical protein
MLLLPFALSVSAGSKLGDECRFGLLRSTSSEDSKMMAGAKT